MTLLLLLIDYLLPGPWMMDNDPVIIIAAGSAGLVVTDEGVTDVGGGGLPHNHPIVIYKFKGRGVFVFLEISPGHF